MCYNASKSQYYGQHVCKNCKIIFWIVNDEYYNKKTCHFSSFRSKIFKKKKKKKDYKNKIYAKKLGKKLLDWKSQTWKKSTVQVGES